MGMRFLRKHYGPLLGFLFVAIVFIRTWIRHGFWDRDTAIAGAFFVIYLFLVLGLIFQAYRFDRRTLAARTADSVIPSGRISGAQYKLPMMPIRDMVLVPRMKTPFVVGRNASVRALEYAMANDQKLFLATQRDASVEDPTAAEIAQFGCICKVLQNIKMADGNFKVLVEGLEMGKMLATDESRGFFLATVQSLGINGETLSTTPAA